MSLWEALFSWLGKILDCLFAAMDAFVDKLTTQLNLTGDENRSIVFERPIGNNRQAQLGMAKIPAGAGLHRVPDLNGGRF